MASLNPKLGVLGISGASHLLRRVTFGPSKNDIINFSTKRIGTAITEILTQTAQPGHPIDPLTGQTWVFGPRTDQNSENFKLFRYVGIKWMSEHFQTNSIHLKMMLFLHQYFTSDSELNSQQHYAQMQLFRKYALGSYKELAKKMVIDNGMLRYLDGGSSTSTNPNENFAREFLELFTIGKGPTIGAGNYTNYTEDDIVAAARIFTGFKIDWNYTHTDPDFPGENIFRGYTRLSQHDQNPKVFSSAFGGQTVSFDSNLSDNTGQDPAMIKEVSDFVEMVFAQDETAKSICRRLYRFFVHYDITPEIETDIITPLAVTLKSNNYDLSKPLEQLLKSEHFYDIDTTSNPKKKIGGLLKSPLDLVLGSIKFFEVPLPDETTEAELFYNDFFRKRINNYVFENMGIDLFSPSTVAGYVAFHQAPNFNRNWISENSLAFRYQFADMLLTGKQYVTSGDFKIKLDVMQFIADNIPIYNGPDYFGNPGPHDGPRIAEHLVQEIVDYLLPQQLNTARLNYFKDELLLDNLSPINWMFEWDDYVNTGNDESIRPRVEKLIRGLMQSPEYQLC